MSGAIPASPPPPAPQRTRHQTDKFDVRAFHHIEILCADAASAAGRFAAALGCAEVANSGQSTGNYGYASRVMASGECLFAFTAPYGPGAAPPAPPGDAAAAEAACPNPSLPPAAMRAFVEAHGMSVYAVGVHVTDAGQAFSLAVAQGAVAKAPPRTSAAGDCTVTRPPSFALLTLDAPSHLGPPT